MSEIVNFFLSITQGMGYLGVFLLMAVESSFIPFPSEIVIPPAAYLASKGEMNIFYIIIIGVLGSLLGALINYFLAYFLGRKVVFYLVKLKYSKFLLISEENLKKAEDLIKRYGSFSTFFGRLLPAVRQLISIPAGFSKMNILAFIFFTTLGSSLWIIILALLGYYFGENQDLLSKYYFEISMFFVGLVASFIFVWFLFKKLSKSS